MKKILSISIPIFIILVFALIVYASNRDFHIQHTKFYRSTFNSEVVKITEGRGTKIFYDNYHFFYTDFCQDNQEVENVIKVGDVVRKQDSILEIFRENSRKEMQRILTTKVGKPSKDFPFNIFN